MALLTLRDIRHKTKCPWRSTRRDSCHGASSSYGKELSYLQKCFPIAACARAIGYMHAASAERPVRPLMTLIIAASANRGGTLGCCSCLFLAAAGLEAAANSS